MGPIIGEASAEGKGARWVRAAQAWCQLLTIEFKPKLTLDVVVTGRSAERIAWGDWGEAVMLAFRYAHPRTGADVAIRQAVRVPRDLPLRPQNR